MAGLGEPISGVNVWEVVTGAAGRVSVGVALMAACEAMAGVSGGSFNFPEAVTGSGDD